MFSQATIMGRVTGDLELKMSAGKVPFVSFSVAVNKGNKDNSRVSFYRCILFREPAENIIKAGVKKGSLLMITGELEMTEYESKTKGMVTEPKITVHNWEYVPIGAPKQEDKGNQSQEASQLPDDYIEVECDEELPFA